MCTSLLFAARAFAQVPAVSPGGVVNGGTFSAGAPVAPGSIVAIFGTNLATGTATAASVPLPTILGGTTVTINGRLAPLFFVSPLQIDIQLPFETAVGSASAVVTVGSAASAAARFNVASTAPGLLLFGTNRALAINPDGSLNNTDHAAKSGDVVVVYLTGQGSVDNPVATGAAGPRGPLANATAPSSATIGGQNADILFLGLAPDFVGLTQANIRVPNLPSGDYPLVVTIGGTASNSGLLTVSGTGTAQLGATVIRTMVYNQITSFAPSAGPEASNGDWPVMSKNGNAAAFSIPGANRTNRIFRINTDGTNQQMVDSYAAQCFCGSKVDISSDGATIVSTESMQLRVAGVSGASKILNIDGNEMDEVRITGDGSKIYFLLRRDTSISGTSTKLQQGLYSIASNGSGIKQLVGPAAVASTLGLTSPTMYFYGEGNSLAISTDGSRIVFAISVNNLGEVMLGVNSDGSGLHQLSPPSTLYVGGVALSGNGTRAGYARQATPCCSSPWELGAVNFDGTARTVLNKIGGTPEGDPMSMDTTGALLHWEGVLYNTDGSSRFQTDGSHAGYGGPATLDSVYLATMNSGATRLLYVNNGQLATMDLNPTSLGAAPALTNPTLTPAYVLTGQRSRATVTAKVGASGKLNRVESNTFRNGYYDYPQTTGGFMADDGSNGDVTPKDGVYTFNGMSEYNSGSAPTPLVVRIYADVTASDGFRHATDIDVAPFFLLAAGPGPAPQASSLSPTSGPPGTRVTISGSGFDSNSVNNIVLFGNRMAPVVSSSANQIVATVPLEVAVGAVPVAVATGGQTSNAMAFTVTLK